MKKIAVLFILAISIVAVSFSSASAQNVVTPSYQQYPDSHGYPSHPVVIRNTSPYELQVEVQWPSMKYSFSYTVKAQHLVPTMLPSGVRLNVRAWAWVYNKNGKREPKEMQFHSYSMMGGPGEVLTVFWFPRFK